MAESERARESDCQLPQVELLCRVRVFGLIENVLCVSKDAARILISPNNATRTEGQNVTFECNLEGRPLSTVTWWKDSTQINTSGSKYQVSQAPSSVVNSTATLTIIKATSSDEGFYQCRAENQLGSESSKAAYLTVHCKLTSWFAKIVRW